MTARSIKRRKYGPVALFLAQQKSIALELWMEIPAEARDPRFCTLEGFEVSA